MTYKCNWIEDEGLGHETDCGHVFCFNDDGPTENLFKFCPYCGRELVDVKSDNDPDNDDD